MLKVIFRLYAVPIGIVLSLFPYSIQAENNNFNTTHFSGSGNCALCHDGLIDNTGQNVSIVNDWSASMMANSTKDPYWRAKVATELERNPHLSTLIQDKCTKCHAPMANYEITKVQGGEVTLFGANGVLNSNNSLHDAALNGVSCTVCHQITDDASLGTLEGFSGHYNINDTKTIYGQYSNIFAQPMINNTGYTPTHSAHVSDSAMCATCHNLKTPYVDANGTVLTTTPDTEFPEQMPYTEWQNSEFDDAGSNPQSCQDCHMPQTISKVSSRPRWLAAKEGFSKHHLVGANTTMMTLLRDNAAQLDVTSTSMDVGISRARDMLRSSVTLEILSASVVDGVLEAQVKMLNNSGHKTPTAYPSRRMWLNFKVTDSNNIVVFESGAINADGSVSGADNDFDQQVFEPHYDLITSPDQVQIYETIMGDSDSNVTFTLLRGAQYLKDNRLTPRGFNKQSVPSDVAVHGAAMSDADFNLGSDIVTYRFPVAATGDLNINVALNYQTIAQGVLQDLYRDNQLEQVQTFRTMYEALPLKHEQITSVQITVVSDGGGIVLPLPVVTLSATPVTIDPGQTATLNWNSTDAINCTASGDWSGQRSTSGSEVVSPAVTATYTLNCSGDGGTASDSVTVTVNQPILTAPTVTLTASAASIIAGSAVTLTWSSTDSTSCIASGGWSGSRNTSGSEVITPAATATYTLDCSGDGGTASDSVTVTVNQPVVTLPTVTLTASAASIIAGSTVTLNWSSTDATSCTASGGWNGPRSTSGSEVLSPAVTTTYTIDCSGDGGTASDSVTVAVNQPVVIAPTVTLTASPTTRVAAGSTITLTWSSTDALSCSASGGWSGQKPLNGSESFVLNAADTFTMSCTGDGGTVSQSVSYSKWGRWLWAR